MRAELLIRGAAFMAVALATVGTASAQQALRGADTLENVIEEVIANCPGAIGNIVYVGGGSEPGQGSMRQRACATRGAHVAPA